MTRFYRDLAVWWPLLSPPEDYAEEAAIYADLLSGAGSPVNSVLELGSGGGHNAVHLKSRFTLTLSDLSEQMLDISRGLNPECEHVVGDMRTLRLGRRFDGVFIHDAIHYMKTESDLAAAFETAAVHCRRGGVLVIAPDEVLETFEPDTSHGGSDAEDGRGARYLEWSYAATDGSGGARTEYSFVLRSAGGAVSHVHETHSFGLFPRAVWLAHLDRAGFDARIVLEDTDEHRPRELFVGRRRGPS